MDILLPNIITRMPSSDFLTPRSEYIPRYIGNDEYDPMIIPRSNELSSSDDGNSHEAMTLDMMRQTAPFKKMDAFGNVIMFEGRGGERVLYRPPNDNILINSYYLYPLYNQYAMAEYLLQLQRLRSYASNYNFLKSSFLNGLYSYPY